MRILTITFCVLFFVPMSLSSVLANSLSEDISEENPQNKLVNWTTQANSLTTIVAKTNQELPETKKTEISNSWSESDSVEPDKVRNILQELEKIGNLQFSSHRANPGVTISNPSGFGGDGGKFFFGIGFASDTRFKNSLDKDAGMGFGVALGNAREKVGLELTYTMASLGLTNRDFGSGGFSAKLHRLVGNNTSVALGYHGFLNFGDDNDFEDTIYGVVTNIFRTRQNLNSAFSRVAVSVGLGNGIYRSWEAVQNDEKEINIFGSVAFRISQPISFITEWTGHDLGLGLSVAPFKNIPLTITPALRDISGGDDSVHFNLAVGLGFSL